MPSKRKSETEEERNEGVERKAQQLEEARAREDDAIDAMIRRSIEFHGP